MATKNLSRTVIEGGRARSNRWERRHSNKQARVAANATFAKMHGDCADAIDPPHRKPVGKDFRDKPHEAFRQDQRVTETDEAFWLAIPDWFRKQRSVRI